MPRIAMIGAGSIVFCKTLMMDIMSTRATADSTFVLMSPTAEKLKRLEDYAKRIVSENDLPSTILATTNRREALRDADYVILMFQIGGIDAFQVDYEVPLKYGVDQCIGDSMNPGGIFRSLRSIPVLVDIVKDMQELCPKALIMNYVNPMAVCCWTLGEAGATRFVGLCHGVQTTLDLISRYVGVKKEQIDYVCAGINHMGWFLKIEHEGKDLYPILRENIEKPEYYINEKVRCEVMRHFGYFMTESTGHLSEYLPWFRKNKKALDLYCDQASFGGESGAYYKWCRTMADKFKGVDLFASESTKLDPRSAEYCSYIIEALETSKVFRLNGNIRNNGLIADFPDHCCAEVPIYVDRSGLHPTYIGHLPPQCAAMNLSNITVQGLTVRAGMDGDPELVVAAMAMDPLTCAVCTLNEVREMATEMLEAEKRWLPQFEGKTIRKTPVISIPKGTMGVDVPLDPALAIGHRFGELMQR
ncbi:MAG TPA: alpha-galactosidase [bacterium]|nr:alpha-galactosidase [bacterium]